MPRAPAFPPFMVSCSTDPSPAWLAAAQTSLMPQLFQALEIIAQRDVGHPHSPVFTFHRFHALVGHGNRQSVAGATNVALRRVGYCLLAEVGGDHVVGHRVGGLPRRPAKE